jgi:acyl-CoA synthetase (AMP-forming)/AMP-acid ligase II
MLFRTNLVDVFEESVARRPGHPALVDNERRWTYQALHRQVLEVSWLLRELGVQRGDRVGISLPKSTEEVVGTLAAAGVHAAFVNINVQLTLDQLLHVVTDAGIRVLLIDERRGKALEETGRLPMHVRLVVVGNAGGLTGAVDWQTRPANGPALSRPLGNDIAALLYTSGSTGRPKGVIVTHGMLIRGAEIVGSYLDSSEDDRVLSVPPLSFDYGLNQLMTTLLVGGTLVLERVPLPAEIAKTVAREHVTGLPLVAPSWVQLVRYLVDEQAQLTNLRYVTNTGGAIPRNVLERLPELLPGARIFLMYGLTEAFRSTYLPPEQFSAKMGAIGQAIPNVEIFVVHPQTGICGPDEVGELVHRGDLISRGYWQQPGSSGDAIHVNEHLRPLIGEEPVLHSGDWVRRDRDGTLWYVGRMDSMIKCSGFRISPTEIEEIVCLFDGVDHAVAFGAKDEELGQVVHVAVQWRAAVEESGLEEFLRGRLPRHMLPRVVHTIDAMPRTATGKIDRQAVTRACIPSEPVASIETSSAVGVAP